MHSCFGPPVTILPSIAHHDDDDDDDDDAWINFYGEEIVRNYYNNSTTTAFQEESSPALTTKNNNKTPPLRQFFLDEFAREVDNGDEIIGTVDDVIKELTPHVELIRRLSYDANKDKRTTSTSTTNIMVSISLTHQNFPCLKLSFHNRRISIRVLPGREHDLFQVLNHFQLESINLSSFNNNIISPQYELKVAKQFASSTTAVKRICCCCNKNKKISNQHVGIIYYVLKHSTSLQTFDCTFTTTHDIKLSKLIQCIDQCSTLETLLLSYSTCGIYTIQVLGKLLLNNNNNNCCRIRKLEMKSLRPQRIPRDLSPIATALLSNTYLEELDLSNNNTWIHSNTIDILLPVLQQNQTLKKLSLSSTGRNNYKNSEIISTNSWINFGMALANGRISLKYLDISGNPINVKAWTSIGNGLKVNTSLVELIASDCCCIITGEKEKEEDDL